MKVAATAADDDSGKSFTRNWSVSKVNDVHFQYEIMRKIQAAIRVRL